MGSIYWVFSTYACMSLIFTGLTTLSLLFFKEIGLSNGQAAIYSALMGAAYIFKPAMAPYLERTISKKNLIPQLQTFLGIGFILVALIFPILPSVSLIFVMLLTLSFLGAVHDVFGDGIYVTQLPKSTQIKLSGLQSAGWVFGRWLVVGGLLGVCLWLVSLSFISQSELFIDAVALYRLAFLILGLFLILNSLLSYKISPLIKEMYVSNKSNMLWVTFKEFFSIPHMFQVCTFIFLFKLSVGLLESPSIIFLTDQSGLALNPVEFSFIYGTMGVGLNVVGGIAGGLFLAKYYSRWAVLLMWASANLSAVTYFLLSVFAVTNVYWIAVGVGLHQFLLGFGAVACLVYILREVAKGKYAVSFYCYASSILMLCVVLTGAVSGYLQMAMGYTGYFAFVIAATIPSLIACTRVHIGRDQES